MKSRSAILLPNWIGDLLLVLSVVERLPARRRAETTLLVPKKMGGLVALLSELPQIAFDRADSAERSRTLESVQSAGFSAIYLLPYSFSSAWFAFQTGIPVRRGLSREMRGLLLTERLPGRLRDKSQHITKEYAEILQVPYCEPEAWGGKAVPADEHYRGVVVYCPGAAYGPAKRWPHFAELARLQAGERVVVLGTAADSDEARKIAAASPGRVEDLTGKTSLVEAAGIMAAAKAVVSNDSGLMHLAGFVGTPLIGMFGSTSPVWTRPLGSRSIIMQSTEPCAPCFRRTCRYGHYRCQENLLPSMVAEAFEEIGGSGL
ncbi:lipopolysaccharide heptosyltransferase II [Chlorobium phaeovibrioides]|uniref:lipopolysaccharide heptosyltransferase II n=1 Tax=Chlorobium phaeovibrioides TaxID=1094 RepID=UPI000F838338|nr:lipopolysaccharide heptosyltransferase II [Chlorobium phaeovibrioides]RTY34240.1 lipopolysaccharide heptosyltransferase II [Chlorobium phaeovibrioides]